MKAYFTSKDAWYDGIRAAVMAGLTFEAWEPGVSCACYWIEYTGGY